MLERFKKDHFFLFCILAFIVSLLQSAANDVILENMSNSSNPSSSVQNMRIHIDRISVIIQNETEESGFEFPDLRVVASKKPLPVYVCASTASRRTSSVPSGQLVKVVTKKRDWTKIRYYDEALGTWREGWVFGRYLEKVDNSPSRPKPKKTDPGLKNKQPLYEPHSLIASAQP